MNIGDAYCATSKGSGGHSVTQDSNAGSRFSDRKWSIPDGLKPKDLCLVPERFALAMQARGWWVRSRIAWCKRSCMPESVRDRPTGAWEYIWMFSKSAAYFYDDLAVRQPDSGQDHPRSVLEKPEPSNGLMSPHAGIRDPDGRNGYGANLRNYWLLGPEPFPEAHFATFPREVPRRCIRAGTSARGVCPVCGAPWVRQVKRDSDESDRENRRGKAVMSPRNDGSSWNENDGRGFMPVEYKTTGWASSCACDRADTVPATVLDPFLGSGTTAVVAIEEDRDWIGIELNEDYVRMAERRIAKAGSAQIGMPL